MQMKREDDTIKGLYVASTHDYLLIFTSLGRCYWLKVWQIPESSRKSKGKPLINLLEDIQPNEKIATIQRVSSFEGESCILMTTRKGVVKKSALNNFSNPRRKGIWALDLDEGDEVVAARIVNEGQQVMIFTYQGMAVRFAEDKVRPMGRMARGVKGVTLKEESDYVVGCEVVNGDETILVVCENGFGKRSLVEDFRQTNRGGVGVRSIVTSERNGNVVGALCVADTDGMVMMTSSGQTIRISMRDLRVLGRTTQGVKLANLREGDFLVAIQKVSGSDENEEVEAQPVESDAQVIQENPDVSADEPGVDLPDDDVDLETEE